MQLGDYNYSSFPDVETEALSHSAQVPQWPSLGASLGSTARRGKHRGRKEESKAGPQPTLSGSPALTSRVRGSAPAAKKPSEPTSLPAGGAHKLPAKPRAAPNRQSGLSKRVLYTPALGPQTAGAQGSAPFWSSMENAAW